MADKKQRAWVASEDGEGHSVVIFHHHGLAARREGANALGMEFDEVECKRAPHFDSFADQGHVPPLDLLKAGLRAHVLWRSAHRVRLSDDHLSQAHIRDLTIARIVKQQIFGPVDLK